jgi:CBS domain containing-hemolysin-like protein
MPLEDLLDLFLENQGKMAVAVNEYGGAVGTITLNNVLEELVGSIQDEFDSRQEPLTEFGKDDFDVDGTLPLHDLTEQSGMKFEPSSASTIGGYVTELLRHLPARGESIRIGDFTATVAETDGRRILVLNFKKHDSPAD